MDKQFRLRDIQNYIAEVASGLNGRESVGLAFLASCDDAKSVKNAGKRDHYLFSRFGRTLYSLLCSSESRHDVEERGRRFLKNAIEKPDNYAYLFVDRTLLGSCLSYVKARNPGYFGLGESLSNTGKLNELGGVKKRKVSKVGSRILFRHFSDLLGQN